MKYKIPFLFFIALLLQKVSYCQMRPIDVIDETVKLTGLGGEQTLYFGFNAGDQIIFNYTEADGKELKELEIGEYPSNTKFADYKTKETKNKTINVGEKGIWFFHFANSAFGGRICKIKIQRIPANDASIGFNTDVGTHTVFDTTYSLEQEKYLVKSDTVYPNVKSTTVKVHSSTHFTSDNSNTVEFTLPENTIAWSYYIGVSQQGVDAFDDATQNFANSAAPILAKTGDPLAALAVCGVCYFTKIESGDAINYYILNGENVNLFSSGQDFHHIKKGYVINDFSKMEQPLAGTYYVCLVNDNLIMPDQVLVKVTAVCLNQQWATRQVKKMHVESKEEMYLKN
jgi:hypothetical protein